MPASLTLAHEQPVTLKSLADVRRHFATNRVPYYFISPSNFNLMGIESWVAQWHHVNLIDCFDGAHPDVTLVPDDPARVFQSVEEINAHLLASGELRRLLEARRDARARPGELNERGRAIFLFFDEQIEAMCESLGLDVILPPQRLVREIDSKIATTALGNEAGVPSVPNVVGRVGSYAELQRLAASAGLGERWVVQTPYGDSGKTTFFIDSEADYQRAAEHIEAEPAVKVMRRINCVGTAIEACATRWGTVVGPLCTELIGIDTLTPHAGGWCGNELHQAAFTPALRREVQRKTEAIGDALYRRGYRGQFELDYLLDLDTGEVWLGELNARLTGITAMTNLSNFSARHLPLFLFHLLEHDRSVELALDVPALNRAMLYEGASGHTAQLVFKHTAPDLQVITEAPASGVYRLGADGRLELRQAGHDRRQALASDEAFVLRIMRAGEMAYHGADLAIVFVNEVISNGRNRLNAAGERWVDAIGQAVQRRPLDQAERAQIEASLRPIHVKSGRA